MGLSIFQIGLTLSFLVTLIVVLRLYRGVRILNARVGILSNLVRELRKNAAQSDAPIHNDSSKADETEEETANTFMQELEEERVLQKEMRRDFSLARSRPKAKPAPRSARKLRGMPAQELQSSSSSRLAKRSSRVSSQSTSSQPTSSQSTSSMRQRRLRPKPMPKPMSASQNELTGRLKKLELQLEQTKDQQRVLSESNNKLKSQCQELSSMNDFLEDRFSEQEKENTDLRKSVVGE